jgi:hypothetical protein
MAGVDEMKRIWLMFLFLFLSTCSWYGTSDKAGLPDASNTGDAQNPAGDEPECWDAGPGDVQDLFCEMKPTPLVNFLLVADRSQAMAEAISPSDPRSKAEILQLATGTVTERYQATLRFGWMGIPGSDGCEPGTLDVPFGDRNAGPIADFIQELHPGGSNSLGDSLAGLASEPALVDPHRQTVVVLVTGSLPACPADSDAAQAVHVLRAAGVDTFVVGLGRELNESNPVLLNDLAVAGGHPLTGEVKYRRADSLAGLEDALMEVARSVTSCEMMFEPAIPETCHGPCTVMMDRGSFHSWVGFWDDGFTFSPCANRVEFGEEACGYLSGGEILLVEFLHDCGPP